MSNPDKHKPLSPEELLKLLDNKSGKEDSFDEAELDDFEKEALEGFSSHTKNAAGARRMMDDINVSISDEVSGRVEKNRKNKIIWFSAAASLAVIIIISAVFFKQTEVGSNIALNEAKEEKPAITETTIEVAPPAKEAPVTEGLKLENQKQIAPQEIVTALPDAKVATEQYNIRNAIGDASVVSQESAMGAGEGVAYKDAAKNKLAEMDAENNQVASNTAVVSDKINEKVLDEITRSEDLAIVTKEEESKNVIPVAMSAENTLAKADSDKKSKEKAAATKAAKAEDIAIGGVVNANMPAPGYVATTHAYYAGGELAIKNYVLNYFKEHKETIVLKGKYKIKALISEQGLLKVISVQNTSYDCSECIAPLTKVLNTMINWIPAKDNNKAIVSETEFVLMF